MADHQPRTETEHPNFPVPRELRDHIYEYLFDAEDNIYQPEHTIRLDTAIFGVNKTISREAKDAFAKQNTFVQFDVDRDHCSIIRNAPGVRPLEGYTGAVIAPRNWCGVGMKVTIHGDEPYRSYRNQKRFVVLVRRQDLDAIAQALQWWPPYAEINTLRFAVKIGLDGTRTHVLRQRPNVGSPYDITFCLKDVCSEAEEAVLLEPFMSCIGPGHSIRVIGGCADSTLPARLVRRLTPKNIDPIARAWTVLHWVNTWCRSLLDANSSVDDTPRQDLFSTQKHMKISFWHYEWELLGSMPDQIPDLASPTARTAILLEDAQLSSTVAFMRTFVRTGGYRDLGEAAFLLNSSQEFETFIQKSPSMRELGFLSDSTVEGQEIVCHPLRVHLCGLLRIINLLCEDADPGQDARDVLTQVLDAMAAEKDKHPKLSYIARDYEALTELASDPVQVDRLHPGEMESSELLGKLSISDPGIMEEAKIAAAWDFTIPDSVDGWERRVD